MNSGRATRAAATIAFAVTLVAGAAPAYAAPERRDVLAGSATGGQTRTPTPVVPGEVQLMRGFDLRYLNGDHHIRRIGVLPETDGDVRITFDDRNSDDLMNYVVSLTNVQLAGVVSPPTAGGICGGGTCTFPLQAPPDGLSVFVLRGFELTFLPEDVGFPFPGNCNVFDGCDHHLSIVGIRRSGNNVEVTYRDQNGDDDYAASVAYSWVPRSLIDRFHTVLGTIDGGTRHTNTNTSGAVAITGFRIGYVPIQCGLNMCQPDNHILRFRYQLTSTGVDTAFHDNDPDTRWEQNLTYVAFE